MNINFFSFSRAYLFPVNTDCFYRPSLASCEAREILYTPKLGGGIKKRRFYPFLFWPKHLSVFYWIPLSRPAHKILPENLFRISSEHRTISMIFRSINKWFKSAWRKLFSNNQCKVQTCKHWWYLHSVDLLRFLEKLLNQNHVLDT